MKELQMTLKNEGVTTMVGVLAHAVKTHRNKPVLGMRRLIKEEGEKQPDGRVFQKVTNLHRTPLPLQCVVWTEYTIKGNLSQKR